MRFAQSTAAPGFRGALTHAARAITVHSSGEGNSVMRTTAFALAAMLMLPALGRAAETPPPTAAAETPVPEGNLVTTSSGLQYADIIPGTGEMPQDGDICILHYTGWLEDGTQFDSSRPRGKPFGFKIGAHQVIKGWEEGVHTMRVGGTRRLIIPPELAYGERGIPSLVPPNARLTFEVELLRIKHEPPATARPLETR